MSLNGRLVEVANVGFVVLHIPESGFGRLAALEKREWQKWVGFCQSASLKP